MTSKNFGRHAAAALCGAALLVAGCDSTGDTAPAAGGGASATTGVASTRTPAASGGDPTAAPGSTAEPTASGPTNEAGAPQPAPAAEPGPASSQAPAPTSANPQAPQAEPAAGAIWDPCTLPDSDVFAAGLDPATEQRITDAAFPNWRMCKWQGADRTFELVLGASDRTVGTVLEPGTFYDLRRTYYYGREVAQYRNVADTHKLNCYMVTPATYGTVEFNLRNTRLHTDVGDVCENAGAVGAALLNSLH